MPAYLGLGSNRGDRTNWLRAGIGYLRAAGLTVDACSSLWLSEPMGDPHLPWFVNCVLRVVAPPTPDRLLEAALEAERRCGRERVPGELMARTFDADVLLYDARVMSSPALQIPHPRMHERRFVLEPLSELVPDFRHPVSGASLGSLRAALARTERAWLLAPPLD